QVAKQTVIIAGSQTPSPQLLADLCPAESSFPVMACPAAVALYCPAGKARSYHRSRCPPPATAIDSVTTPVPQDGCLQAPTLSSWHCQCCTPQRNQSQSWQCKAGNCPVK